MVPFGCMGVVVAQCVTNDVVRGKIPSAVFGGDFAILDHFCICMAKDFGYDGAVGEPVFG